MSDTRDDGIAIEYSHLWMMLEPRMTLASLNSRATRRSLTDLEDGGSAPARLMTSKGMIVMLKRARTHTRGVRERGEDGSELGTQRLHVEDGPGLCTWRRMLEHAACRPCRRARRSARARVRTDRGRTSS